QDPGGQRRLVPGRRDRSGRVRPSARGMHAHLRPLNKRAAAATDRAGRGRMATEPGYLLVVEDNPVTGDLLARWPRGRGHTVTVCADGNTAVEVVAAGCFDLVLLDVGVPGLDGFGVLRELRGRHAATALPIVMATALGQSEMVVRALGLGANDYVTKPY